MRSPLSANQTTPKQDLIKLKIAAFLAAKDVKNLRLLAQNSHPVDFALALEELDDKDMVICLRWLKIAIAAKVFANLTYESQKHIINTLTSVELNELIDDLYPDEIVDLIEEMPSNLVKKILRATPQDMRGDVNRILQYEEDSAGSLMHVNFLELDERLTAAQALKMIQSKLQGLEETEYFFVTDQHHTLVGTIELKTIVFAKPNTPLIDLSNKRILAAKTSQDQEDIANLFLKYNLDVLPIVNNENRLMGIVDSADVVDVIEQESTEDIQKLAGIDPIEKSYFETSIFRMVRSRSVWLLFLMISATVSQLVITAFLNLYGVVNTSEAGSSTSESITLIVTGLLVPLLPLVSGTSGNAGSQSSTMVVRALSLKQVKTSDYARVLWKELRVALISGLILVVVNFARMIIIYIVESPHTISANEWRAIAVLSLALYVTVIIAKLVGGMLPVLAKKVKLDPAVMAAPLLTTLVDALSTAIFFSIGAIFFLT